MFNQFLGSLKTIGKKNQIKGLKLLIILSSIVVLELLNFSLIIPIITIIFNKEAFLDFEIYIAILVAGRGPIGFVSRWRFKTCDSQPVKSSQLVK